MKEERYRLTEEEAEGLLQAAEHALPNAYAPYSGFYVAAALRCKDGTIYTGVNVENASYPAGNCAERTAIFKAVSEGKQEFSAIAIVGGKGGEIDGSCPPCGICRQVMREFCEPETFFVILGEKGKKYQVFTLEELLPESFGPEKL